MGYVKSKWEIYDDLLLRNEMVKMIEKLFIVPYEFNPYEVIKQFDFVELVSIYQEWNSSASSLTRKEVKQGHRALITFLSSLLYSGYITTNTQKNKIKELIDYVMNNLNYHGKEYVKYFEPFEAILEETAVFTYALLEINLTPEKKKFVFTLKNNLEYTVEIPKSVFYNSNLTNSQKVFVKMVVFPFNPLLISNETFFVPTVSISFDLGEEHLNLSSFKDPVKITIPHWAGSQWLAYKPLTTNSNESTYINIPHTFYENTLYKVKFHVLFQMLNTEAHRVSGLLTVALCNYTAEDLKTKKHDKKTMDSCFELYLKNVAFYIEKKLDFRLTLPFLLVTKVSSLLLHFKSTFNISSTFSIEIMQMSCQYWYNTDDTNSPSYSSSYGCAVSPEHTNDEQLVCLCYHLSTFSEGIRHIQKKLNYSHFSIDNTDSFYIGLFTTVFIWAFFLSLSIYAFISDHKNAILSYPVDLADNYPSSIVAYMVLVETGLRPYASCDGTVFIQLHGTLGKSLAHKLKCSFYKTLQKGQQNLFIVRTNRLLGQITNVRVWINQNNEKKDSKWYLSEIKVYDLQNMSVYIFLCSEWLATNSKTRSDDVTFVAASSVILNDFKYYFTYNFRKNFHNDHVWFSIFTCSTLSTYTRLQRTHVCLLNSQIFLLTTLIVDYLEVIDNRNADVFYSGLVEVTLALVCGFLLIPMFSLIIMMFGDSKKNLKQHIVSDWKRYTTLFLSKKEKLETHQEEMANSNDLFCTCLKKFFRKWKTKSYFRYLNVMEHEKMKRIYLSKHPKTERDLQENDPYDNLRIENLIRNNKNFRENKTAQNSNLKSSLSHVQISIGSNKDDGGGTEKSPYLKHDEMHKKIENISWSNKKTQGFVKARRSQEKVSLLKKEKAMDSASRQKLISDLIEQGIEQSSKFKRKKLKKPDYGGSLPFWVKHFSWALLIAANLFCSYSIVLLISWKSKLINLSWYLRVFGIFCANIFILDPFVIIFLSFIASLLSKTTSYFNYSKLSIIKTEALANLKNNLEFHYTRVNAIRSDPQYFFRSWNIQKFKTTKKIQMTRRLISKILISLYLALCSLVISLSVSDRASYQAHHAIKNNLFGAEFFKITNREMFYDWMKTKLIEELYDPHEPKYVTNAMQFSRIHKFEYLKNLDALAISYPCITRIPNLGVKQTKEWNNYLFGPELMTHDSYCLSYNKNVAIAIIEESEKRDFLNTKHIGEGFTFYLLLENIKAIAWVFVTVTQDFGGGITANLKSVVILTANPISYYHEKVVLGISMFFPAFAFFIFNNMKNLFYDGAGHFFSSIANILNMIISFMVLILTIIAFVVLPGMEQACKTFYHDTGTLETQFYNSGISGVCFLLYTVTFLSLIKLIEVLRVFDAYDRYLTTSTFAFLEVFAIIIKLLPLFCGISLMIRNSQRVHPLYARMFDICYTKNLISHSGAGYLRVFAVLSHLLMIALLAAYNATVLKHNYIYAKYFKKKGENYGLLKELLKQAFNKEKIAPKETDDDIELRELFERIKLRSKRSYKKK